MEHTRYLTTNNKVSAYALNILNNGHECGGTNHRTIKKLQSRN